MVKAIVELGAAKGPGDVEYLTLRGNKPALGLLELGVGRKPERRRAVTREGGFDEEVLLKRGVMVGETAQVFSEPVLVPKYPPSMVMPF